MKDFEFIIKDDEQILVKLLKVNVFSNMYYEIHAFNQAKEMIGYLGFEMLKDENLCDLRSIAVDPRYLARGVGSSMSSLFEQYMLQNNCHNISGVYFPYGEGEHLTPKFYSRHGYRLGYDENFWALSKQVYKTDSNVPQFIEYEEQEGWTHAPWEHQTSYSSQEK